MRNWMIVLGVMFSMNVFSQQGLDEAYTVVEKMPVFKGGNEQMYSFVSENIKYPREAKSQNVQGTVYVKFIVDTSGSCVNPEIARGVRKDLDDEAKRVISLMRFEPGVQGGKKVKVQYTLPIAYKLSDK